MKRFALAIPFLFTLASLLQLYYISAIVVSPDQILRPLVALWLLLIFLILPVHYFLRDWNWTVLFLTVFVAGFYFSSTLFLTVFIFIIIGGGVWMTLGWLKNIKFGFGQWFGLLAGVGIFFVGYSLFVTGNMLMEIPWKSYKDAVYGVRTYSPENFSEPAIKRDVYYIVLDGYARSDIVQEVYGFDNSEFETYLEKLGFVIPVSYHSNYPATHLSIASTLNMQYLQELVPGLEKSYNRWLMKPIIDNSRVRTFLENEGYKTIAIGTNWSITNNTTTDLYYHPYPVMLSDFEGFVLDNTPLSAFVSLIQEFASVPSFESQRKTVLYNFETLASLPEVSGPKFVFAHIISPHPPFVFDRSGNPVDTPYSFSFKDADGYPGSPEEYRLGYLEQLQFVNHNLEKTIAVILSNSEIPPIIILQADHGSGLLTDFSSLSNTCVKERFSPFAAYYLPDLDGRSIPPEISAVNTFRIIINEYFNASLPLLENRQYYYKDPVSFYEFDDVTGLVNEQCKEP
jgi:hypothetical protein